jgi:hypothetical protein
MCMDGYYLVNRIIATDFIICHNDLAGRIQNLRCKDIKGDQISRSPHELTIPLTMVLLSDNRSCHMERCR